jgi:AraC family transcriptional regulator
MLERDRYHDLNADPRPGMPSLGARFSTETLTADVNTGDPFQANFVCPELVFSLQLAPRFYALALDTDRLAKLRVPAGSIQLSPAGSSVKCISDRQCGDFIALQVAPTLAGSVLDGARLPADPNLYHPEALALGGLLQRFVRHPIGRDPLLAETLTLALLRIIDEGLRARRADPPRRSPGLSAHQGSRVREYIDAHLHEKITLTRLSAATGLPLNSFARQFKQTFGVNAYAYVTQRRLERARYLILATHESLAEVAFATGFSSQAHMTACFSKHLGVAPGVLRRSSR